MKQTTKARKSDSEAINSNLEKTQIRYRNRPQKTTKEEEKKSWNWKERRWDGERGLEILDIKTKPGGDVPVNLRVISPVDTQKGP